MNHAHVVNVVEGVQDLADDDSGLELPDHVPLVEERPQVASGRQLGKGEAGKRQPELERREGGLQRVG